MSSFNVTTLSTHKTESGLTLKLQQKQVAGEHTTYQIMAISGFGDPDNGLVLSGATYSEACDCLDWWLDGCPV